MTIKFYRNLSDNKVMDKNITQVGTDVTGVLRDDCSIINPVVMIEDFTSFNPKTCNYAYISEFGRYYYITNIICKTDKLFEIHMHVDVLKSFASGIRSNQAVIGRQQTKGIYDLMLNDGTYKVKANPNYNIMKFPNGFSGEHYILIVAGT